MLRFVFLALTRIYFTVSFNTTTKLFSKYNFLPLGWKCIPVLLGEVRGVQHIQPVSRHELRYLDLHQGGSWYWYNAIWWWLCLTQHLETSPALTAGREVVYFFTLLRSIIAVVLWWLSFIVHSAIPRFRTVWPARTADWRCWSWPWWTTCRSREISAHLVI